MSSQRGADGFPPNPHPVGLLEWGIEVDRRETINQKNGGVQAEFEIS